MVIAFAGTATEDFEIGQQIEAELQKLKATVLISSAHCGTEILALEIAGRLNIRRSIVLPFEREIFRQRCVLSCSGDWDERYNSIIDAVKASGDIVTLGFDVDDQHAHRATNDRVLAEARTTALGLADSVAAILVRDKTADDRSAHFLQEAERASLPITQILHDANRA